MAERSFRRRPRNRDRKPGGNLKPIFEKLAEDKCILVLGPDLATAKDEDGQIKSIREIVA